MSDKKPEPVYTRVERAVCPVCGKPSYSVSGTHPQCEITRADALTKAAYKAATVQTVKPQRPPHAKQCVKCKRFVPLRRAVCDCGHSFAPKVARI